MKQKIKLTKENDGTIHVDDVDVSNGVYAKSKTGVIFLFFNENGRFFTKHPDDTRGGSYSSLREFILEINDAWTAYTIHDGLRIVTEKELSVLDLKDGDHVGFITSDGMGFVVKSYYGEDVKFQCGFGNVICRHPVEYCDTMREAIIQLHNKKEVYKFDNLSELYAWLAE